MSVVFGVVVLAAFGLFCADTDWRSIEDVGAVVLLALALPLALYVALHLPEPGEQASTPVFAAAVCGTFGSAAATWLRFRHFV